MSAPINQIDSWAIDPWTEHEIRMDLAGQYGVDPLTIDDRVVMEEHLEY